MTDDLLQREQPMSDAQASKPGCENSPTMTSWAPLIAGGSSKS